MTFFNIFTLVANTLNLIFIIFVLFFERKESGRRFAWLLALVFLPVVGMILYILCSGHFFTSTRKMEKIRKYILPPLNIRGFFQINCTPLKGSKEHVLETIRFFPRRKYFPFGQAT